MRVQARILIAVIFLFSQAYSQTCLAEIYSWNQAVIQATESNNEFQASKSDLLAAQEQEQASRSGFYPQISASVGYNYGSTGSSDKDPSGSYSASLTATQSLFSGFQDISKLNQARANVEQAETNLTATKAKLSYDLKNAFAGLAYAQKSVKLAEDILSRRQINLRQVELRFESGRENRGAVLLSKAYLEQAKLDLIQAKNQVQTSKFQLAQVLNINEESAGSLEIAGEIPYQAMASDINAEKLAVETTDYKLAVAKEKASQASYDIAKSSFYPSLSLSGVSTDSGANFYPNDNRWSVGVTLSIPLFSGGKDYYGAQASKEAWRAASYNRNSSLKQVITKIKTAQAVFIEAAQKLEVDRSFSEAITVREKIGREKYNNGLTSFDDWDTIENDYITRQKNYLQSEKNRALAQASWEQTLGKGVIK